MALLVRVEALRKLTRLSMQGLAERTGIPLYTLYSLDRGERGAGATTISRLLAAFPDLDFEDIFDDTNSTVVPRRDTAA